MTRRHRGYSLVELMISMTLGILVIGGLYGAYLAVTEANRQRVAFERRAGTSLFTMDVLADAVRMSGFGLAGNGLTGAAYEITVSYLFDTDIDGVLPGRNCLGEVLQAPAEAVQDRYYLVNGELMCDTTTLAVTRTQRLAGGVTGLTFLYRYNDGTATDWHADPPGAPDEWTTVTAVRISAAVTADPLPDVALTQTVALRNT